jgi:hypothetical protein
VTKSSTAETPQNPMAQAGKMGWVQRWGQGVRASFVGTTDGAQYRIMIEEAIEETTKWTEVRAWSHQLRWDCGG